MTSKLKPGRELDLLVAEKIFGATVQHGQILNQETDWWDSPKCYSEDISRAWEVLKKMSELGYWFSGGMTQNKTHWFWIAKVGCMAPSGSVYERATAQLAICLAALKAKGVEID
jgi:hypothetical protein